MSGVHVEHVSNRSDTEPIFLCQVKAIQAIDELGTVCHCDLLGMLVKDIESHRTENGISQSRDLFQNVAGCRLTARSIPRSPLIHNQLDLVFAINFPHNLPMA